MEGDMPGALIVSDARVERSILLIRGRKVMLDADLAELYGVSTKVLNQAPGGGHFFCRYFGTCGLSADNSGGSS
jgi:hypothetical protein